MLIRLTRLLIILLFSSLIFSEQAFSAQQDKTPEQKITNLEQQIQQLQQNQQTDLRKKDKAIDTLTRRLDQLTAHQKLENDILAVSEKFDNIDSQHNAIFNISSILIGAIALFGLGGATFTIYEVKSKDTELRKIVDDFNKERENVLEDFENKGKKLMQQVADHESKLDNALKNFDSKSHVLMEKLSDYDKKQENALEDFDIESKKLVKQFDHFERLIRLTQMINVEDFDSEVFYSDLTQMAQAPTPLMSNLMTLIVDTHRADFDQDVLELAQRIKSQA